MLGSETLRLADQGTRGFSISRDANIFHLAREHFASHTRKGRLVKALSKIDPKEERAFAESWPNEWTV